MLFLGKTMSETGTEAESSMSYQDFLFERKNLLRNKPGFVLG